MIKPITKDILFLQQKSQEASQADLSIGQDLQDTLLAHRDACVGLAANMIGVGKPVMEAIVEERSAYGPFPVLISKAKPYKTEESCLSLKGSRPTTRYEDIVIRYRNQDWQEVTMPFTGFTAQIIQHELDHLEGVII